MVRRTSPMSLHRSDSSTISASGEGEKFGGRLVRSLAIVHDRLRHALDDIAAAGRAHQAGNADALAAFDQNFGERQRHDQRRDKAWCRAPAAKQTPSTASGRARSTPCARLPIPARAHRDDRRAPSAANRRARPARRKRSGGIARNSRRVRRGGGRAGRGSRWRRRGALPGSAAAWRRQACGLRRPHVAPPGDRDRTCAWSRPPSAYPIRAFRRPITASMLSPSARADEGERHAVLEHRLGEIEHVVDRRREPPVEQRAGAHRQHQRLAGARATVPRR